MLSLTIFVLAAHIIIACHSTRLPLEVYELTPNAAGGSDLKHKNLEYSTINGQQHFLSGGSSLSSNMHKPLMPHIGDDNGHRQHQSPPIFEEPELKMLTSLQDAAAATLTGAAAAAADGGATATTIATTSSTTTNQLDRRRSRQMLDMLQQKSHHDQTGNHKLPPSSGAGASGSIAGGAMANRAPKDVRILYQVGVSIP
uniref:Uncharacterized protein n=1 Tax=Stomoxys calcitrans TaxID=35570 RepID=A0A1I8PTM4_STOCA